MDDSRVSPSYASHVSHRNNKIWVFTRETEVARDRERERQQLLSEKSRRHPVELRRQDNSEAAKERPLQVI